MALFQRLLDEKHFVLDDFSHEYFEKLEEIFYHLSLDALLGWGRHRAVFASNSSPHWVYKIPLSEDGAGSNHREARIWEQYGRYDGYFFYAENYLEPACEIPVLRMERVVDLDIKELWSLSEQERFRWIWSVDCSQVGFSRSGLIVAYDFGY